MEFFVIIYVLLIIFLLSYFTRKSKEEGILKIGKYFSKKLQLNRQEIKLLNSLELPYEGPNYIILEDTIFIYRALICRFPNYSDTNTGQQIITYINHYLRKKYSYKYKENQIVDLHLNDEDEVKSFIDSVEMPPLSDEQERKMYMADSSRWKRKYEEIIANYQVNNEEFYTQILRIASQNGHRMALRSIYYQAHSFMADKDKLISIYLYIYYLSVSFVSVSSKPKNISVQNKKILFKTKEQQLDFEDIKERFLKFKNKERNIKNTIDAVNELFAVKRKKIELNANAIIEAQKEHDLAVDILNEYLSDENEESPTKPEFSSPDKSSFTEKDQLFVQEEFLNLFASNKYKLNQIEIDTFAQTKGVFKSQLINDINELYYEELDDVLIEEDKNFCSINEAYYHRITQNDNNRY